MQDIPITNQIALRPKTELVRSYYDKHKDISGDDFEEITHRKQKFIRKYINPLNALIFKLEDEIVNRPGDKEFRNKVIEIQGQLIGARNSLLKHYELEQTIK